MEMDSEDRNKISNKFSLTGNEKVGSNQFMNSEPAERIRDPSPASKEMCRKHLSERDLSVRFATNSNLISPNFQNGNMNSAISPTDRTPFTPARINLAGRTPRYIVNTDYSRCDLTEFNDINFSQTNSASNLSSSVKLTPTNVPSTSKKFNENYSWRVNSDAKNGNQSQEFSRNALLFQSEHSFKNIRNSTADYSFGSSSPFQLEQHQQGYNNNVLSPEDINLLQFSDKVESPILSAVTHHVGDDIASAATKMTLTPTTIASEQSALSDNERGDKTWNEIEGLLGIESRTQCTAPCTAPTPIHNPTTTSNISHNLSSSTPLHHHDYSNMGYDIGSSNISRRDDILTGNFSFEQSIAGLQSPMVDNMHYLSTPITSVSTSVSSNASMHTLGRIGSPSQHSGPIKPGKLNSRDLSHQKQVDFNAMRGSADVFLHQKAMAVVADIHSQQHSPLISPTAMTRNIPPAYGTAPSSNSSGTVYSSQSQSQSLRQGVLQPSVPSAANPYPIHMRRLADQYFLPDGIGMGVEPRGYLPIANQMPSGLIDAGDAQQSGGVSTSRPGLARSKGSGGTAASATGSVEMKSDPPRYQSMPAPHASKKYHNVVFDIPDSQSLTTTTTAAAAASTSSQKSTSSSTATRVDKQYGNVKTTASGSQTQTEEEVDENDPRSSHSSSGDNGEPVSSRTLDVSIQCPSVSGSPQKYSRRQAKEHPVAAAGLSGKVVRETRETAYSQTRVDSNNKDDGNDDDGNRSSDSDSDSDSERATYRIKELGIEDLVGSPEDWMRASTKSTPNSEPGSSSSSRSSSSSYVFADGMTRTPSVWKCDQSRTFIIGSASSNGSDKTKGGSPGSPLFPTAKARVPLSEVKNSPFKLERKAVKSHVGQEKVSAVLRSKSLSRLGSATRLKASEQLEYSDTEEEEEEEGEQWKGKGEGTAADVTMSDTEDDYDVNKENYNHHHQENNDNINNDNDDRSCAASLAFTSATTLTLEADPSEYSFDASQRGPGQGGGEKVAKPPRLVCAARKPRADGIEDVKELTVQGQVGLSTTISLKFGNRKKRTQVMTTRAIQMRFDALDLGHGSEGSGSRPGERDNNMTERDIDNAFHCSPRNLEVLPNADAVLYITFSPESVGIYSGALKIKSSKKSYIILLRGEAVLNVNQSRHSHSRSPSLDNVSASLLTTSKESQRASTRSRSQEKEKQKEKEKEKLVKYKERKEAATTTAQQQQQQQQGQHPLSKKGKDRHVTTAGHRDHDISQGGGGKETETETEKPLHMDPLIMRQKWLRCWLGRAGGKSSAGSNVAEGKELDHPGSRQPPPPCPISSKSRLSVMPHTLLLTQPIRKSSTSHRSSGGTGGGSLLESVLVVRNFSDKSIHVTLYSSAEHIRISASKATISAHDDFSASVRYTGGVESGGGLGHAGYVMVVSEDSKEEIVVEVRIPTKDSSSRSCKDASSSGHGSRQRPLGGQSEGHRHRQGKGQQPSRGDSEEHQSNLESSDCEVSCRGARYRKSLEGSECRTVRSSWTGTGTSDNTSMSAPVLKQHPHRSGNELPAPPSFPATAVGARRAIYFKLSSLDFGSVAVGCLSRMKVELCNPTDKEMVVFVGDPSLPFVVLHNEITLRPKSFVKLPIRFLPVTKNKFASEVVAQSADGLHCIKVALTGVCY